MKCDTDTDHEYPYNYAGSVVCNCNSYTSDDDRKLRGYVRQIECTQTNLHIEF